MVSTHSNQITYSPQGLHAIPPKAIRIILPTCLAVTLSVLGVAAGKELPEPTKVPAPIDPDATLETKALFYNLRKQMGKGILFGHQHTTCYGIGWKSQDDRSDVKSATGAFPAVYGWDMEHKHRGTDHLEKLIIDAFERGGVNTMSWCMDHPITGGNYKLQGKRRTVKKILPGGELHGKLKTKLDGFAHFVSRLKDSKGRLIPIIFRPWHEHNGGWFWWGTQDCSPEEFVQLWRFTVTYLRDTKKVHNLLYAYSPDKPGIRNAKDYERNRFPGYEYMDVMGVDCYERESCATLVGLCKAAVELADQHGKIAALTEFGYRDGMSKCGVKNWYTEAFLKPLKNDPVASRISYAMTWRNAHKDHFWVPYPGHPAVEDFKRFAEDPFIVLGDGIPPMYALKERSAP